MDFKARYPDFLCIGTKKAATTWIYHNFYHHPQISMGFIKETFYLSFLFRAFTKDVGNYDWVLKYLREEILKKNEISHDSDKNYLNLLLEKLGLEEFYPLFFGIMPESKICGEITPDYSILSDDGIKYILSKSPNIKIFLICRDPVERDLSHASMEASKINSLSNQTVYEILNRPDCYMFSDYPLIIDRWLKFVPIEQFKVFFYDDLIKDSHEFLGKLASFLNITHNENVWKFEKEKIFTTRKFEIDEDIKYFLVDRHKDTILEMAKRYPTPCINWVEKYKHMISSKIRNKNKEQYYYLYPKMLFYNNELLEIFIDNYENCKTDYNFNKLILNFQMVCLFKDKEINGLLIQSHNKNQFIEVTTERLQSPYIHGKYSDIPWSKNSRFKINMELETGQLSEKNVLEIYANCEDGEHFICKIILKPTLFPVLINNLPKLHFWNNQWVYGGFNKDKLKNIYESYLMNLSDNSIIVETGAGLPTLACLSVLPEKVYTIDHDKDLKKRIEKWIIENNFPLEKLEFICERSEIALPKLALSGLEADLCIIDGNHGLPAVFVDFCYMNMMLKKGGILIVDDHQIYSVYILCAFLKSMPGWRLVDKDEQTCIFIKDTNEKFFPDFGGQPWVLYNTLL